MGGARQRAIDIRESNNVNQAALKDLISAQHTSGLIS